MIIMIQQLLIEKWPNFFVFVRVFYKNYLSVQHLDRAYSDSIPEKPLF